MVLLSVIFIGIGWAGWYASGVEVWASAIRPGERNGGSSRHCAPVWQEGRKTANIHTNSGFIWGIPAKIDCLQLSAGHGRSQHRRRSRKRNLIQ
jgi:hypothetical protein